MPTVVVQKVKMQHLHLGQDLKVGPQVQQNGPAGLFGYFDPVDTIHCHV
jgi:hypothetical protein